jgi:hypothetical protein
MNDTTVPAYSQTDRTGRLYQETLKLAHRVLGMVEHHKDTPQPVYQSSLMLDGHTDGYYVVVTVHDLAVEPWPVPVYEE